MKQNLESTLREKVFSLLEETMERTWGITIPKIKMDITDQLGSPLKIYVPVNLDFQKAKKFFKKEFLSKELQLHFGNISELAKLLEIDRRSIHRTIKEMNIDLETLRKREFLQERYHEEIIDQTIRNTLEQYKEFIQPQKMEQLYQELPHLSRNLAKVISLRTLTWKEAEQEFEEQFLSHVLEECRGNKSLVAKRLKIRIETLHRKIKKFGLKQKYVFSLCGLRERNHRQLH